MSLRKNNLLIDCDKCKCISTDSTSGFDVIVPICDTKNGICESAILHCVVSPNKHEVTLKEWHLPISDSLESPEDIQKRLTETLKYVADHRICGNKKICPQDVVQIVRNLPGQ